MAYSNSHYQPSILELARQGNFRAIAYWINSLLAPQGIYIQAEASRSGCLKIFVNFHHQRRRDRCVTLRQTLVRFICYRLWTLNSSAIRDVRVIARMAGEADVLWQQSVRISTPANARRRSRRSTRRSDAAQVKFRILRSFLLNRFAFAGFILCYWFLYLEATGFKIEQSATEQTAQSAPITAVQTPGADANRKTEIARAKPIQPQSLTFTAPDEYKGKIVHDVNSVGTEKVVALTFDDGPWPNTTEQILDILKQNDIKGTFYWVGVPLQNNPEIAKKVVAAGHAIGNHTWQHLMNDMDEATAAQEIGNLAKIMHDITGVKTTLMRPPGGNLGGSLAAYAQKLGYTVTMWSADSEDYYVSAPIIVDNVLKNTKPGGIVLMHDGGGDRNPTVEALPQVIDTLKRRGYRFVTIPELLNMKAQRQSTVWQKGGLEGRSH